jgi:hypothetical protein
VSRDVGAFLSAMGAAAIVAVLFFWIASCVPQAPKRIIVEFGAGVDAGDAGADAWRDAYTE